ncbi:MAG: 3'(2'),5'-bisphosphate nucleotidase CysQ [Polyangiales bacterium]
MLERELRAAEHIARTAGAIVMELYEAHYEVAYKTQFDPVTDADTRANAYIVQALRDGFAGDGIVAEESDDQSDALKGGRCWYVDPLDGTKEFIAKNGEFAVMLGLAIDGEASLGVVYQPVRDRLYSGALDQGAVLEEGGSRQQLTVSSIEDPSALSLVVSRSHRGEPIDDVKDQLRLTKETQSGSVGLKIGLIAQKKADLYVHMSNKSSLWDACGPEAILRAAGGRFTDLGGRPYRYGGTEMRNERGILACNARAFDAVLPVVQAVAQLVGLVG